MNFSWKTTLMWCALGGVFQAAMPKDGDQKRARALPALLVSHQKPEHHRSEMPLRHQKETNDGAKKKFTTMVIAPSEATACLLPEIYSFNRQGKSFLVKAIAIGLAVGLGSYFVTNQISQIAIDPSDSSNLSHQMSLLAGLLGMLAGGASAALTFDKLKSNLTKDEDQRVLHFIEKHWEGLFHNKHLVWAQHVVGILNYLKEKYDNGTFNLEEAKLCISALQQKSRE